MNPYLHLALYSIGDNVNPRPMDKPYISLFNKVETQILF